MASWPLNPLAFLWRGQGLDWLLDVPEQARAPRPSTAAGRPEPLARSAAARPAGAAPAAPVPAAGGSGAPKSAGAAPVNFAAPLRWPDDCPEKWAALMARARPSRVLWTYYSLGDDMLGTSPQRVGRGNFLRQILRDLGHPRGTHGFWPMAVGGEPRADLFYAGARRLGARGLVVFGSRAAGGLGIAGARPLLQIQARGMLIMVLWELDALMRQEKNYSAALAFLRRAIATVL